MRRVYKNLQWGRYGGEGTGKRSDNIARSNKDKTWNGRRKSSMIITGLFSKGSFEKRPELRPSRISISIPATISSFIFSETSWISQKKSRKNGTTSIQWVSLFINHLQGRRLDGVAMNETISNRWYMMMIAFIAFNGSLVPLIECLCTSNPSEFEFSGFGRNWTDNLGRD